MDAAMVAALALKVQKKILLKILFFFQSKQDTAGYLFCHIDILGCDIKDVTAFFLLYIAQKSPYRRLVFKALFIEMSTLL